MIIYENSRMCLEGRNKTTAMLMAKSARFSTTCISESTIKRCTAATQVRWLLVLTKWVKCISFCCRDPLNWIITYHTFDFLDLSHLFVCRFFNKSYWLILHKWKSIQAPPFIFAKITFNKSVQRRNVHTYLDASIGAENDLNLSNALKQATENRKN